MTEIKRKVLSDGDEYDMAFADEARHNPLIPDLTKTRVNENPIPGLAGMMIPLELMKLLEFGMSGMMMEMTYTLLIFIVTFIAAAIIPLRIRMMEISRLGTPTIEMTMLGRFSWTEYYRIIDMVPAAAPSEPLDIGELLASPTADQLDKWGVEIDDEYLNTLIRNYREGTQRERFSKALAEQLGSLKRYVKIGIVLGIVLYLFWPVISLLISNVNWYIMSLLGGS